MRIFAHELRKEWVFLRHEAKSHICAYLRNRPCAYMRMDMRIECADMCGILKEGGRTGMNQRNDYGIHNDYCCFLQAHGCNVSLASGGFHPPLYRLKSTVERNKAFRKLGLQHTMKLRFF